MVAEGGGNAKEGIGCGLIELAMHSQTVLQSVTWRRSLWSSGSSRLSKEYGMNIKIGKKRKTVKRHTAKRKPAEEKPQVKKIEQPAAVPAVKETTLPQVQSEHMTEAKILEAFDAMGITAKLNIQQKKLFLAVAKEFRLNPLRREIHAVKMGGDGDEGGTLVPVVGYEVYIDRAEETGRLEYWFIEEAGEIDTSDWRKSTYRVTLVVKRRDWPKEFRWTVRYTEAIGLKYNKTKRILEPNSMWRKRGHFMTQKCTIGQGFRLAFRESLRGMPYIDAEIENAENGEKPEEEKGELRAPQTLTVEPSELALPLPSVTTPELPIEIVEGQPNEIAHDPYSEIMAILNAKEKSREGPMIALFAIQEKIDWKDKADKARGNLEEILGLLQGLDVVSEERRIKIKEEI